jgi:branched-chain amino acid transport system permease protein
VVGAELLQFALAGLKNGAIYALVALGFTVVYASTQVINFAQGEFYMLGGMLGVFFFAGAGLPLPLAALASVAATAAIGLVFEVLAIRPRTDGDPLAIIIITVGGSLLLRSLARHLFGGNELALPAFTPGPSIAMLGATIERQTVWLWGLAIVSFAGFWWLYRRTWFGRAMRAAAIDRDAARLMGVDTATVVMLSFALAAALGAVAGVAVTPMTQTSFDVGASIGLKGFAAAILGGLGNPMGAIAGGLLLGLVESLSIAVLPSEFKDAVALVVLLAVLFIRPQGLLGGGGREKV